MSLGGLLAIDSTFYTKTILCIFSPPPLITGSGLKLERHNNNQFTEVDERQVSYEPMKLDFLIVNHGGPSFALASSMIIAAFRGGIQNEWPGMLCPKKSSFFDERQQTVLIHLHSGKACCQRLCRIMSLLIDIHVYPTLLRFHFLLHRSVVD